jgi:hypothetical protein
MPRPLYKRSAFSAALAQKAVQGHPPEFPCSLTRVGWLPVACSFMMTSAMASPTAGISVSRSSAMRCSSGTASAPRLSAAPLGFSPIRIVAAKSTAMSVFAQKFCNGGGVRLHDPFFDCSHPIAVRFAAFQRWRSVHVPDALRSWTPSPSDLRPGRSSVFNLSRGASFSSIQSSARPSVPPPLATVFRAPRAPHRFS